MTTPTITLYPDTLPAKGQPNAPFDLNVDDFMSWLTATNGPELATMITWTQGVAGTVLATALAGDLPPLTGEALSYIRANAAENGGEFRTPAEVLADIDAASTGSVALKANIASPTLTGVPAAPTAAAGTNTDQIATTQFTKTHAQPKATSGSGAGQFTALAAATGDALSVPAGGTWQYFIMRIFNSELVAVDSGVVAGGTVIQAATANVTPYAWAWRTE
tara:strand:- start:548 stop:1207 length:660 start_codon:yes stop_codon:yes gene_type:complete